MVKPRNGSVSRHVTTDIQNLDELKQAINFAIEYAPTFMIEKYLAEGFVHRITIIDHEKIFCAKQIPANVVGDGESSIRKLIEEKNKNVIRKKIDTYKCIQVGAELKKYLSAQELSIVSVPKKEERIFLHPPTPSDMELGGDTIDITDSIHPSVKKIMLKVMQSIPGLELGGVDYMSKDIFSQQTPGLYRIIEINTSPDFSWNEFPLEGKRRNVSFEILKIMFPGLKK